MNKDRINFTYSLGILAVIEGTVKKEAELIEFELAMTESITGPIRSVINRQINLSELESIRLKRRIFRKSCLEFTARSLLTFESFPGYIGLTFSVLVKDSHKQAVSFVRDVLFDMTQIETEELSNRISADTIEYHNANKTVGATPLRSVPHL